MKHIVLPDSQRRDLTFYLAMEEFVASNVSVDSFFVWRVAPTVIIGRNQVLENEANVLYCNEHDVKIVRRKSGGGCVYSDEGNIMLSYISERGEVVEVFDRYMTALSNALNDLGLPAEKSGRNDVLVAGRKVSGNAFHQLPDRSIVHGTLLYSTDIHALTEAILPPQEKLQRHGVESVRQRVLNISDYIRTLDTVDERLSSIEALEDFLLSYFCEGEIVLTPEQVQVIETIEKEYIELNNTKYHGR